VSPALVDTSVWRRYLAGQTTRQQRRVMDELLDEDGAVLVHPAVVGELVLGGLSEREEELLGRLPHVPELANAEILSFVKHRGLTRRGIGWVDAHLLANALVASADLWTFDRGLATVAVELGVAFAVS
jgi:predicted nucleic acid-binding protein